MKTNDLRKTKTQLIDELRALRARTEELERTTGAPRRTASVLPNQADWLAVAEYTYDLESWIGTDGRLLWVNPAVERLTGYSPAECLDMPDYPMPWIDEQYREEISRAFRGALAGTCGNDLPFRIRRKDGTTVWAAVSWQPMFRRDGTCLGYRSSIRDISDRKRAEEALQRHRSLLDSIIAHIPCGIYWKDRGFAYEGCNKAFALAAGVAEPEQIIGKTDYDLPWEKEQTDWFRQCDARVMAEDSPLLNIEEAERLADGRQVILLTSKVPRHDPDGRVCGVLGIDTDITELKHVEEELRGMHAELETRVRERTVELAGANEQLRREIAERRRVEEALRISQERYRLVSELTSDYAYVCCVEANGSLQTEWATDAFARLTGYSTSGRDARDPWERIVHPDDRIAMERRRQTLLAGRSTASEFRIITHDGRLCWLSDLARPIWDDNERRVVRILGAAQDITQRRQAEEEARRHEETLMHVTRLSTMGELAAQLAHELNQPLCAVVGNAQTAQRLLSAIPPDLDEVREAVGDIVTHGKLAGQIIQRLREFLRQQQTRSVVLNIQRVIEEVAGLAEIDARQHHAGIRFELHENLPGVRGDPIQLQQVILNLIRNGLESMDESEEVPRELLVRTAVHESGGVVVSVRDRGVGLPAGDSARLFEPFFTTKSSGLGMGLSISRSIIEAHNGRLWATANSDGGTTFHFTLPGIEEAAPC